jgi:hypothetical protein
MDARKREPERPIPIRRDVVNRSKTIVFQIFTDDIKREKKSSDCPDADKAVGTTCEYLACEGSGTGASRTAARWSIHSSSKGFLISHQMSHSVTGRFFGTQVFFARL